MVMENSKFVRITKKLIDGRGSLLQTPFMATMNLSLPDHMKNWKSGSEWRYADASDDLVREDVDLPHFASIF